MNKKKVKISVIACVAIVALVGVIQLSGMGDWIKDHSRPYCSSGLCALKLYDRNE